MIVTKEQQEALLNKYIKDKHNTDECVGFVDGINAALELVNKLSIPNVSKSFVCDEEDKKTICDNPLSHECCNKHHKRI